MAIEHFLHQEDRLYKILHPFLNDNQKDSLILNFLIMLGIIIMSNKFLRNKMDPTGEFSGIKIIKLKTGKSLVVVTVDNKSRVDCFIKDGSFLAEWREVTIPEDLCNILRATKTKKDTKIALQKLMKLKAFW